MEPNTVLSHKFMTMGQVWPRFNTRLKILSSSMDTEYLTLLPLLQSQLLQLRLHFLKMHLHLQCSLIHLLLLPLKIHLQPQRDFCLAVRRIYRVPAIKHVRLGADANGAHRKTNSSEDPKANLTPPQLFGRFNNISL